MRAVVSEIEGAAHNGHVEALTRGVARLEAAFARTRSALDAVRHGTLAAARQQ